MKRRVFDTLTSVVGLLLVVVLLVAGSLLIWGYSFTTSNVHNQLAKQEIVFPSKIAFAHAKPGTEITPSMIPSVSQYAGEKLLTGAQAQVYANDFIAVHLSEMPYNGVYAAISNAARAAKPSTSQAAALSALETTSFQGTTLRGLLLEADAFSVFGEMWASIGAYVAAVIMAVLVGLGFWHAHKTPTDLELV